MSKKYFFVLFLIFVGGVELRAQRLPVRQEQPQGPKPFDHVAALNKYLVTEGNPECVSKADRLLKDFSRANLGREFEEWKKSILEKAEVAKKMVWVARSFFKNLDQLVSAEEKGSINSSYEVFRSDEFRRKSYAEQAIERASREISVRTYYYGRTVRQAENLNQPMIVRDSFQQLLRIAPTNADVRAFYRGERNQITPFIQVRMNGTDYSYEILPFRSNHELFQIGIEVLHDENLYSPNSTYFDKDRRGLMERRVMLSALGELELFSSRPISDYDKSPMSPSLWVHKMIGDSCFGPKSSMELTQELLNGMRGDEETGSEPPSIYQTVLKIEPITLLGRKVVPARILDIERVAFLSEVLEKLRKELGPTPDVINPSARPAPIRLPAPQQRDDEAPKQGAAEVLVPGKGSR